MAASETAGGLGGRPPTASGGPLAILGVGMMGEALLAGLVRSGWDPAQIRVAEANDTRRIQIGQQYGVVTGSPAEVVAGAAVAVVVVKPYDVAALLESVRPVFDPACLVVSLAAGLTTAAIENSLPAGQPLVRVMPNTAVTVGEGMSALCAGSSATPDHLAQAEQILAAVGQVRTVTEKDMDAVTAVSGSGPAYVMMVAEAMIDAGVLLGLPRPVATQLVAQTLYGSAKLLRDTGQHPTVLRENVTSPGGTTAAGLRQLEDHALKSAFIDAIEASYRRSVEMGQVK